MLPAHGRVPNIWTQTLQHRAHLSLYNMGLYIGIQVCKIHYKHITMYEFLTLRGLGHSSLCQDSTIDWQLYLNLKSIPYEFLPSLEKD